jgi:hypothetical protein
MDEEETFPQMVAQKLAFLRDDHGFRVVSESDHMVRLESASVGVEAIFDSRGELDVTVSPLAADDPFAEWSYVGMVGKASLPRLLELAAKRLREEEPVLRGDPDFFRDLAAQKRLEAEQWTAYYSGRGPKPQTGKLP